MAPEQQTQPPPPNRTIGNKERNTYLHSEANAIRENSILFSKQTIFVHYNYDDDDDNEEHTTTAK